MSYSKPLVTIDLEEYQALKIASAIKTEEQQLSELIAMIKRVNSNFEHYQSKGITGAYVTRTDVYELLAWLEQNYNKMINRK